MKSMVFLVLALLVIRPSQADSLKPSVPKSFSKLMKTAIEAKDAPAACWYLGNAQGYLRALGHSGNLKASKILAETKDAEGKCGGKNSLDLKATFTAEEWAKLTALQAKIEAVEL